MNTALSSAIREIADQNAESERLCVLFASIDNAADRIERAIAFGYSTARIDGIAADELRKILTCRLAHGGVAMMDAPVIPIRERDVPDFNARFDVCRDALKAMLAARNAFVEYPDHNFDMTDSEYREWRDRRDELQDASTIARRAFDKACVEFLLNKDERTS